MHNTAQLKVSKHDAAIDTRHRKAVSNSSNQVRHESHASRNAWSNEQILYGEQPAVGKDDATCIQKRVAELF